MTSLILVIGLAGTLSAQENEWYILNRGGQNILAFKDNESSIVLVEKQNQQLEASMDFCYNPFSGSLVWANTLNGKIVKWEAESSGMLSLIQVEALAPVDLELDYVNQHLYWADNHMNAICRSDFNGGSFEILFQDTSLNFSAIAYHKQSNELFYADIQKRGIWRLNLADGSSKELLQDDNITPVRLALDTLNHLLYWADDEHHKIESIHLDGSQREVIYQGSDLEFPFGLFLDYAANDLYWTDYGLDVIQKKSFADGSVKMVVDAGLKDPVAIVSLPVQGGKFSGRNAQDKIEDELPVVLLYPNPAENLITISSIAAGNNIERYWIYDGTGKQVLYGVCQGTAIQLDVRQFSEGLYSYVVHVSGHSLNGQFSIIR